uniref:Uncharacterized protein n=1 Tax=Romanomermis culicivorax TaxID=13658 RepID=A0A915KR88_ROMCU
MIRFVSIQLVTALFFYAAMATESRIDDYTLYGDLNSPQLGVDLKSGMKILFIDQKTVQRDNNQTIRFRLDVKAGSMHTTKWGTELVPELLQRLILRGSSSSFSTTVGGNFKLVSHANSDVPYSKYANHPITANDRDYTILEKCSMTNDQDSLTLQVSKLGGKIRTDINVDYSSFDFEIPARHAVEIFRNITEHLLQFYQAHYHFGNMVLIISDMNSHFRSEILTILPSSSQKFIRQEEQPRYTNIPTSFAQFVEKPIEKDLLQIIVMRRQAPQDNVQIFEKWLEFLMNERSPDSLAEILKSEKMIELTGRISVVLHHEYARHVGKKINCLYILFPLTKIGRENHGRILGIYLDYIKLLFGNSLSVMRSWRMFNGLSLNFDDQVLLLNF